MTEKSKLVLVTGASRGIGAQIADDMAAAGYRVVGTATSESGAANISARLKPHGGLGMVLNVGSAESIQQVFDHLKAEFGQTPDILVNNAGITRDNLFMRMSSDEWHDVIDTNLSAVFRVTQPAVRHMVKSKWGRIINIGSVVGASGNPGQANYCASKSGLEGFTKSLSLELSSRNICVNVIAPGFIETDMTKNLTNAQQESIIANVPMKRMGRPQDIAAMVLFLCSPGGEYITGQTIHINGGLY